MEYNIGYSPQYSQERWGNPQTSDFGNAIRCCWNPYAGINTEWFPAYPYLNVDNNYFGYQLANVPPSELLYANTFGYRGILPLGLQRISPQPYPYEQAYPYNQVP